MAAGMTVDELQKEFEIRTAHLAPRIPHSVIQVPGISRSKKIDGTDTVMSPHRRVTTCVMT